MGKKKIIKKPVFMRVTLSEAISILRARLSEHLSPAEKRELTDAILILKDKETK